MGNLTKQVHRIQGLNLRTNQLSKDDSFATQAENVELTTEGYLTKRRGYAEHSVEAGFLQLMEYVGGEDTRNIPNPEDYVFQLLGLKSDGLYGFNEGTGTLSDTWVKIEWGGKAGVEPTFTEPVSWAEYEGVVYMADPSGENELMKFDGTRLYRASMPQPTATLTMGGGVVPTVYVKVVYEFTDWSANVILGEDKDLGPSSNDFTISLNVDEYTNAQFPLRNTDLTGFSPSVRVYVSENPTFGFRLADQASLDTSLATQAIVVTVAEINTALSSGDLMSDIYDYTVRKGLPPKAKYLDFYNGLMVLGNFVETFNGATSLNVNKVTWSDLTTGGSVEVFPSLNQQEVGKSTNIITGIFGESDNLVVFKNRNVFYLSGDLVNGNYRLRDSLSEGIGCVAHQSIIKVDGGAVFLSEKGIYMAKDGYKPIEFSDIIEPLFTESNDLLFSKAVSVLDRLNEKMLLFIPSSTPADSVVVQYDYYHKQWFVFKGIDASGGFTMYQDELTHSDGTKVFLRNEARNDDGVAISAIYSTAWLNLGKPSVKKKFTNFLAFSLDQSAWTLNVNIERDWQATTDTTGVITFPSAVGSEDIGIPAKQCHSMRIILSNDVLDENMMINGYEYEYAETQSRFKGGD